jgi:hypothetical protein
LQSIVEKYFFIGKICTYINKVTLKHKETPSTVYDNKSNISYFYTLTF